jgi:hypothetical protein
MKYSMLLADSANKGNEGHEHIENIIKGIIEGETRVLVSAMSKSLDIEGGDSITNRVLSDGGNIR